MSDAVLMAAGGIATVLAVAGVAGVAGLVGGALAEVGHRLGRRRRS